MTDESAPVANDPKAAPAATSPPKATMGRAALVVAVICLVGWMSWLGYLTTVPSEPVVNQAQILRAAIVVTAKVVSIEKKQVEIEKTWVGEPESPTLTLKNLDKVPVVEGKTYIMPLWNDGRIVRISNEKIQGSGAPAVYPATNGVVEQVRELLVPDKDPDPTIEHEQRTPTPEHLLKD